MRLDLDGIAVSAGSACASGAVEPSHVIAALGLPEQWMRGVIRFSLGRTTTQADIARAVEVLEQAVSDLRSFSGAQA
jgi:cysteine desulfurase